MAGFCVHYVRTLSGRLTLVPSSCMLPYSHALLIGNAVLLRNFKAFMSHALLCALFKARVPPISAQSRGRPAVLGNAVVIAVFKLVVWRWAARWLLSGTQPTLYMRLRGPLTYIAPIRPLWLVRSAFLCADPCALDIAAYTAHICARGSSEAAIPPPPTMAGQR